MLVEKFPAKYIHYLLIALFIALAVVFALVVFLSRQINKAAPLPEQVSQVETSTEQPSPLALTPEQLQAAAEKNEAQPLSDKELDAVSSRATQAIPLTEEQQQQAFEK